MIIDQDGQLEGNNSTRHAASDALARARIVFVYTHLLPAFFQGAPFQATRRPIVSYFLPLSLIFCHCLLFFTVLCAPFQATRRPIVSYFLPLSLIFYHCLVFFTVLCVPMYFLFCVYPCLFFFVGGGGWQVLQWFLTMFCQLSMPLTPAVCVVKTYV